MIIDHCSPSECVEKLKDFVPSSFTLNYVLISDLFNKVSQTRDYSILDWLYMSNLRHFRGFTPEKAEYLKLCYKMLECREYKPSEALLSSVEKALAIEIDHAVCVVKNNGELMTMELERFPSYLQYMILTAIKLHCVDDLALLEDKFVAGAGRGINFTFAEWANVKQFVQDNSQFGWLESFADSQPEFNENFAVE